MADVFLATIAKATASERDGAEVARKLISFWIWIGRLRLRVALARSVWRTDGTARGAGAGAARLRAAWWLRVHDFLQLFLGKRGLNFRNGLQADDGQVGFEPSDLQCLGANVFFLIIFRERGRHESFAGGADFFLKLTQGLAFGFHALADGIALRFGQHLLQHRQTLAARRKGLWLARRAAAFAGRWVGAAGAIRSRLGLKWQVGRNQQSEGECGDSLHRHKPEEGHHSHKRLAVRPGQHDQAGC